MFVRKVKIGRTFKMEIKHQVTIATKDLQVLVNSVLALFRERNLDPIVCLMVLRETSRFITEKTGMTLDDVKFTPDNVRSIK